MAGLKAIKGKIRSIDKTRKVTKAMEAVSAAKMRKAQQQAVHGRDYARAAVSILARVSGSGALDRHPLTATREIRSALYIVITSDKGLAGNLNGGVLRAAAQDIKALDLAPSKIAIIAVGRKANEFFQKRGFEIVAYHENADDRITPAMIEELVREAGYRFALQNADIVRIAYQNFISTFEQKPTIRTVLPLSLGELSHVVADILPAKGKFADAPQAKKAASAHTVEPSEGEVLNELSQKLIGVFVYHALLENKASEHSARMVAMKSASDKAGERGKELTRAFNKARQAAITREVSEIIGGIEAMA
jgi:F-type H+-transporting ATPase subunit gamma